MAERLDEWAGQPDIIRVQAGDYMASDEPIVLQTLLGSCVAACLYDPVNRVIGMNHFLLAGTNGLHSQRLMESSAGYYGIHAMELLINAMLKLGASRFELKAKMFGGANVLAHYCNDLKRDVTVGEANSEFLMRFLETEKIPLIAADIGGSVGRIIQFSAVDFSVRMRTVSHQQESQVVQTEHDYWQRQLTGKSKQQPKIDFFDDE